MCNKKCQRRADQSYRRRKQNYAGGLTPGVFGKGFLTRPPDTGIGRSRLLAEPTSMES